MRYASQPYLVSAKAQYITADLGIGDQDLEDGGGSSGCRPQHDPLAKRPWSTGGNPHTHIGCSSSNAIRRRGAASLSQI